MRYVQKLKIWYCLKEMRKKILCDFNLTLKNAINNMKGTKQLKVVNSTLGLTESVYGKCFLE